MLARLKKKGKLKIKKEDIEKYATDEEKKMLIEEFQNPVDNDEFDADSFLDGLPRYSMDWNTEEPFKDPGGAWVKFDDLVKEFIKEGKL